jgi:hypothetical protein
LRVFAALVLLLSASVALAQELTVAEVVAAHRAGAPDEGILRLIREAHSVATLEPSDLAKMRAAGVPERVIQAMVSRTAPTPAPAPTRPDDPRLSEVVRLVRSTLSTELAVEQVRRSGQRYTPTANDLVYLKQNNVPDAVIVAVLESNAPRTAAATAAPAPNPTSVPVAMATPVPAATAQPATFGPLLRMAGVFRKTSAGSLAVGRDRLEWYDAQSPALSSSLPVSGIGAVWLRSEPRGAGGTVSELCVRTTAGDDFAYRDADSVSGGEAQVLQLFRAVKERFPQLILVEKRQR